MEDFCCTLLVIMIMMISEAVPEKGERRIDCKAQKGHAAAATVSRSVCMIRSANLLDQKVGECMCLPAAVLNFSLLHCSHTHIISSSELSDGGE